MKKFLPHLTLKRYLQVYSTVMFLFALRGSYFLWSYEFESDLLIWPSKLWRPDLWGTWPMKTMILLSLTALLAFLCKPFRRINQITWGISFFFWVSLIHSRGGIYSSFHTALIFFLILPFLNLEKHNYSLKSLYPLTPLFMLPYFLAGFWKMHDLVIPIINGNLDFLKATDFSNVLALRAIQTGFQNPVLTFLIKEQEVARGLYLALILLQSSSAFVFFVPYLYWFWGVFLMLFHLVTPVLMDFNYHPSAFNCFWGLIVLGLVNNSQNRKKYLSARHN